jgi:autophagy-related protein 9
MMTWSELLHRLVLVQGSTRLCAVRDLDELDIVGRIMRKENYLIGMLNAGVLGLYVKGLGPLGGRRFMLTKTLEWNLYLCILDPMFDERFQIKQVRVLEEGLHACALGFVRVCVLALGSPQMQSLQVVYMHSVSACSGVSAKG